MSDIFISHSSKDKDIADKLVKFFEDKGLSCWISSRDILPGTEWAAAISTAITATKVFLIIYTANSSESGQVIREISIAEAKKDVFVVPYKTDDTPLKGSFEYYLAGAHFIIANYEKKDYKLEELYNIVAGILGKNIQNITNNTYIDNIDNINIGNVENLPESVAKAVADKKRKSGLLMCLVGVVAIGIIVLLLIKAFGSGKENENDVLKTTQNEQVTAALSPTIIPTVTATDTPAAIIPEEKNAVILLMEYINKYGNHFENEKGEYYSIKHSYGPVTVSGSGKADRSIDNSRLYLTSRYQIPDGTDVPLELGIYNNDLHLNVWLYYNIKSDSFELHAFEDEEKGKSSGVIKVLLKDEFNGKIAEDDIYDYKESGWFDKADFINNTEALLTVLCMGLETDFEEMGENISLDSLGLGKLKEAISRS